MRFESLSDPAFAGLVALVAFSNSGEAAFSLSPGRSQSRRTRLAKNTRTEPSSPSFVHGSVDKRRPRCFRIFAAQGSPTVAPPEVSFIDSELRGAAMKLHTRKQAPKEGQAEERTPSPPVPYVPTHDDYLAFLIDSQHVYEAFEEVVNELPELESFRNTGLERTEPLEKDIEFMVDEYGLTRPEVGLMGTQYAEEIRRIGREGSIPEFICHYYNFYFAHTAGGRMIGKQMSALLLNKRTLEFYKWEGDLNEIKARVKTDIEAMADMWTREEKDACVGETMAAFGGGGGLNSYLSGGRSGH